MRPPTGTPCAECPWRRESARGWLGPMPAADWIALAHSDSPIACHLTIPEGYDRIVGDNLVAAVAAARESINRMRQCSGAAIFRRNVCKSPRDPKVVALPADHVRVFSRNQQFTAHHATVKAVMAEGSDDG